MTIAITPIADPDSIGREAGTFDITFDNSYTANGYVVTAAQFNRGAIQSMSIVQKGTCNRLITYDPNVGQGDGKLRIWTALGTEATGASDQSTISCRVRVIGPHV